MITVGLINVVHKERVQVERWKRMGCDLMFVLVVMLLFNCVAIELVETKGYVSEKFIMLAYERNHVTRVHWTTDHKQQNWQKVKKTVARNRVHFLIGAVRVASTSNIVSEDMQKRDTRRGKRDVDDEIDCFGIYLSCCACLCPSRDVFVFTKHMKQCKTIYLTE